MGGISYQSDSRCSPSSNLISAGTDIISHTAITSGAAVGNYPPQDSAGPNPQIYPRGISDTIVLYHNGHETTCHSMPHGGCEANFDGVVDFFNEVEWCGKGVGGREGG